MPVVGDGLLFVMSGYREAAGLAIRYAGAEGDITDSDRIAWRMTRGLSYVPSPLLHEGSLYFLERFHGVLSNVDLKTGEEIIALLGQLQADLGVTIISATHDHKMLAASDRVVYLEDGKVIDIKTRDQIKISFGEVDGASH